VSAVPPRPSASYSATACVELDVGLPTLQYLSAIPWPLIQSERRCDRSSRRAR
jgi:hypothetical protein